MKIEILIQTKVAEAIKNIYNQDIAIDLIQISKTKKEFEGDFTVVVFLFLKISKKSPEATAADLGEYLIKNIHEISKYNIVKGFLNIVISDAFWLQVVNNIYVNEQFGRKSENPDALPILIEYSSPNTNKPLHLGHIRNNILGWSVAEILKANGHKVVKVNLVNDRGIHICKSMLAWKKSGNGATPESTGIKGDKLVGDYYIIFDVEYKKQISALVEKGMSEEQAKKNAEIIIEAQEMLEKWEASDADVHAIWKQMNSWVYDGFTETYKKLGIDFDKIYYESNTYLQGKSIVMKGVEQKLLQQKEDNSIWIDLTSDGLDEKLLLRANGTSVYMTQDLGTAVQRFQEFNFGKHIYVVGNEQNYHFQVLSLVLQKLGFFWTDSLFHLSYGMVELPEGKMKSREGTIVDADELIEEMVVTAKEISAELGKLDGYSPEEIDETCKMIALGALKYFILKVDPKKNMLFNPKESVDFNGNTGPFIQYTYARIRSIFRKAVEQHIPIPKKVSETLILNTKETVLIKLVYEFDEVVTEAGKQLSPALIANYIYELVKEYNQFYHDYFILKEENLDYRNFRLVLSEIVSRIIKSSMGMLGIAVPEKM